MEAFPLADMISTQRVLPSERGGGAGEGASLAQGRFHELLDGSVDVPDAPMDEEISKGSSTGDKRAFRFSGGDSVGEYEEMPGGGGRERIGGNLKIFGEDRPEIDDETDRPDFESVPEVGQGLSYSVIPHVPDLDGPEGETAQVFPESPSPCLESHGGGLAGRADGEFAVFLASSAPFTDSAALSPLSGKAAPEDLFRPGAPYVLEVATPDAMDRGVLPAGAFSKEPAHSAAPGTAVDRKVFPPVDQSGGAHFAALGSPVDREVLSAAPGTAVDRKVFPPVDQSGGAHFAALGSPVDREGLSAAPGSVVDREDASTHLHPSFPSQDVLPGQEKVLEFSSLGAPGLRQEGAEVGLALKEFGVTGQGALDAAHAQRIPSQTSRLDSDSLPEVAAPMGKGDGAFFSKSEEVSGRRVDGRSRFEDMVFGIFEEDANSHDLSPSAKGLSEDRKGDMGGLVSSNDWALDVGEMPPDKKVPVHATGFGEAPADADQAMHGIVGARVDAADARVSGVQDAGASSHGLDGRRLLRSAEETIVHAFHMGRKDAILHVEPPDMGRIRIHLSMAESGRLDIHLSTEHPEVMAVLNSNLDGLRSQLDERGVPLGRMDVSWGGNSGGFAGNDPGWSQGDQEAGPAHSETKVITGQMDPPRPEAVTRGSGLHLVI
ncbi:MAG: flagellar hook-length control protein FliK [Deltaproteobacteria bacterium]